MINVHDILKDVKHERELYFELGRALIQNQKFRKSIEILTEALHAKGEAPEDWEIHYLIGLGYKNLNRHLEAFQSFVESARQSVEQKEACYAGANEMLTASTIGDIQPWLSTILDETTEVDYSDTDIIELKKLQERCQDIQSQDQKGDKLESITPSSPELNLVLEEAIGLLEQYQFTNALGKVEAALVKQPYQHRLLFLKIRIMIEGQMDLRGAMALFDDADFGYRSYVPEQEIRDQVYELVQAHANRGNTYFFAALIGLRISIPVETIESWVSKAEALDFQTENRNETIGFSLLHAELAALQNDEERIITHWFEAAKGYYFQAEYKEAYYYFNKIIERKPDHTEAYWYQADVLYITSFITDPPYNDEAIINKAYKVWQSTPPSAVVRSEDIWTYVTIARIHEVLYKFKTKDYASEYWYAVLYLERALLLADKDVVNWTYQGRFFRNLGLDKNSLYCFEKAALAKPDSQTPDLFLEEEQTILQLNTGQFQTAQETLERWKSGNNGAPILKTYHKSWLGYIYFHTGRRAEAISLYNEVIAETQAELFAHQMKMFSYWYDKQLKEARAEASVILDLKNRYTYLREAFTFSWAHLISGDAWKAIDTLDVHIWESGAMSDESFSRIQFYLYVENWNQAQLFIDRFLDFESNQRILRELVDSMDALVFQFELDKPSQTESSSRLRKLLESLRQDVDVKIKHLVTKALGPIDEIDMKRLEYNVVPGSTADLALLAAKARILFQQENRIEAYQLYSALLGHNSFPEAEAACSKIEEHIWQQASEMLKASDYKATLELLHSFEFTDVRQKSIKHAILAIAHFSAGREEQSLVEIKNAFQVVEDDMFIANAVLQAMTMYVYQPEMRWSFMVFIYKSFEALTEKDETFRSLRMEEEWLNTIGNTANAFNSITSPILLEMSEDLIPDEAYGNDWHVITKLIPEMRQRLMDAYGVSPPYINIRPNIALASMNYMILLDEIPVVSAAAETSSFEPIISHLERIISQQLDFCLDMQSVLRWMEEYETSTKLEFPNRSTFYTDTIAQHQQQLLVFIEVLKNLVREWVSIKQKETIIRTFFEFYNEGDEASELTQLIRLQLKPVLPVNATGIEKILLTETAEEKVNQSMVVEEGKIFLAMTAEDCQAVLTELRTILHENPARGKKALIVRQDRLRHHVQKLASYEFPNVIVSSQSELLESNATGS